MAGATIIRPDLQFINRVITAGGESVKKCYQCDTCSVVCNVTPEHKPFPRKEMLFTQWGLKEVVKNPDIWLCHQCSDCTAYCPRGAKPGEVLGALRQMCIEEYATPSFVARMVNDYRYLPLLIAFPVVVLLIMLKFLGILGVTVGAAVGEKLVHQGVAIPEGKIAFSKLFPTLAVDFIFVPAAGLAAFVFFLGVRRYWQDINMSPWKVKLAGGLVSNLFAVIQDILWHNRFRQCDITYGRSTNHLFTVFGFIFLAVVTGWGFFNEWVLHQDSPYFLLSPIKLLAMAGTASLLYGIYNIYTSRQANAEKAGYGSYYDWFLIYVIAAVAVTGLGSWVFRLLHIKILAYPTYFLHLAAVFMLFFYAPFSKMAHMVYRTVAMLYARMAARGF